MNPTTASSGAAAVAHRWPTFLALAMALASAGGGGSDEVVGSLATVLLLLPLGYLVPAALRRPRATWPTVVVGMALFVVFRATDVLAAWIPLVAVTVALLIWGVVTRRYSPGDEFRTAAVGAVLFAVPAVYGIHLDPAHARYVVALGWFAHGVWDLVHLRRRRIVAPTFAEWCGVLDILIAIQLVLRI